MAEINEMKEVKTPQKKQDIDTSNIGTTSSDILIEKSYEKSEAELEKERYRHLLKMAKDSEVLWGTVSGLQMSEGIENHFNVLVTYEGYIITIPDFLFFEPTYDFGRNYPMMNDHDKCSRRFNAAQYMLNAKVPFVLINDDKVKIKRKKIDNDLFDDEYIVEVYANRIKAMEIIRNIYFFHEGRTKSENMPPRRVEVNDIIRTAHVLMVKEDTVLVEACGCEAKLDAYHLNTSYVDNCAKFVSAGDEIPVKVKKIAIVPDTKIVTLTISGRLFANNKIITTMRQGDVLLGVVDGFNKAKGMYTVILKNSIKAACPADTVAKRTPLAVGDMVMVQVRFINEADNFVSGRLTKL